MAVTIDGSAGVTTNVGAVYNGIQSATAQASTSGTSIDFTSIPSWVKRITVMFNGVSTNGTSNYQVQIGAGSVTTSGYASSSEYSTSTVQATSGFLFQVNTFAANIYTGTLVLNLLGSNAWIATGICFPTNAANSGTKNTGSITLGGTLDRVRITTVNGTDTFDAGSINILYE